MFRLKHAARAALLFTAAACAGDVTAPAAPGDAGPAQTISDAAHAGAVPGFYFLPPMVPNPSYPGTFDGGLQPRVEICELAGAACGPLIAQYTTTSGTGGQVVTVGTSSYQVNWHTNQFDLDPARTYRISVFVGAFRLGFADVDVVNSGKELKNVDTQQYIALQDGRTLPIKFRIETGIAGQVIVSPDSAAVPVGGTQQFTATVLDLHGNPVANPTVTWSSSNPGVATVDGNGLATGVAVGQATITATSQAASGSATLVVFNPNTPPVANPDTFDAIGNVSVPVAAPGVLANDTDGEANPLSVVAGTFPTASGGTVTLNADGSFTYLSAAGFTGQDSFEYTVTDGVDSATGTVMVVSAYRVWYVDNAGTAPGDGRDASPFTTLKAAEGASAAGETIFVRSGNGTTAGYDEGIVLKTGQSLTGQGVPSSVTATLNGQTVVLLAAGSAPTVTRTDAGATVQISTGNVVQGLDVSSTAGAGIAGAGFGTLTVGSVSVAANGGPALDLASGDVFGAFEALSSSGSTGAGIRLLGIGGSFSAAEGTITGATTAGVDVTGGDGVFTYGGDVVATGPLAVFVANRTGGALTFGGTIASTGSGIAVQNGSGGTVAFTGSSKTLSTGTNPGVRLLNNTGSTISFAGGGLALSTTTGTGFEATGGGTVTVTGAGNTLVSAGGTALRVENTTIGAAGLSFRSISASGGDNGIVLDNTGALNGLQVTGTGAAGSGGTIQNTGVAGVQATDARDVELHLMNLVNAATVDGGAAGVCDTNTNAGCNGAVKLLNVQGVTLDRVVIDGSVEQGITGVNVTGLSVTNSVIEDAGNDASEGGIYLFGLFGTGNTVTGTTIVRSGGRSMLVRNVSALNAFPGAADVLTITGSTFTQAGLNGASEGVLVALRNGANFHTVLQGSTVASGGQECVQVDAQTTARSLVTATGNTISGCNTALALTGTGTSSTTFEITGNPLVSSVAGNGVFVTSSGSAAMRGTVANNASITTSSAGNAGIGVDVVVDGAGSAVVEVANNTIAGYSIGLRGGARNTGTGTADLIIRDNSITAGGSFSFTGVYLVAGNGSAGESNRTCASLSNNQVSGGGGFNTDYWLEQYTGNTLELQGLVPASGATEAQVEAFVSSRDVGGASVEAFGGAVVEMTAGNCTTP
jgi:hypothetical protein